MPKLYQNCKKLQKRFSRIIPKLYTNTKTVSRIIQKLQTNTKKKIRKYIKHVETYKNCFLHSTSKSKLSGRQYGVYHYTSYTGVCRRRSCHTSARRGLLTVGCWCYGAEVMTVRLWYNGYGAEIGRGGYSAKGYGDEVMALDVWRSWPLKLRLFGNFIASIHEPGKNKQPQYQRITSGRQACRREISQYDIDTYTYINIYIYVHIYIYINVYKISNATRILPTRERYMFEMVM